MNMFAIPLDSSTAQLVSYGVALTMIMTVYIGIFFIFYHYFKETQAGCVMVRLIMAIVAIPVAALAANTARHILTSMHTDNIPLIFSSVLIGSIVLINVLTTHKNPPSAPGGKV